MSDEELGLDTSIEREGSKEFVTVADEASGEDRRLQLESWPIARQSAIVGRGTSCYRTVDSKSVVKFSWVSTSRSPTEPDLLRLARQKKVKGVPRLIGHRRTITIGELRSPLSFGKRRQLRGRLARSEASFSSQLELLPLTDEPTSGRKRKSVDANPGSQKKSRSNSQASKLSQVYEAGSFNSQSSFTSPAVEEQFVDRILSYQATQPAGRPLSQFTLSWNFSRLYVTPSRSIVLSSWTEEFYIEMYQKRTWLSLNQKGTTACQACSSTWSLAQSLRTGGKDGISR